MKVLVVFTGGTIGSVVSEGYISPSETTRYQLIEQYKNIKNTDIEFLCTEPYTLLSENLTGEYLNKLGKCISKYAKFEYDGIIVTHGTDTLQYSAACMSYYLQDLTIPVVFVSSNYVLGDIRANGTDNFIYAVEFIANKQGTGVFVVYRNSDNLVYVHRGTRLLPHLPYEDNLYSVGGSYYGRYEGEKFFYNSFYSVKEDKKMCELELPNNWKSDVLRIYPYPGMEYPELTNVVKAVLLESYHSGTLCSITPYMEKFFAEAEAKKIPVFLTGANEGIDYESVKRWKQLQIFVLPKASPVAMYIKLWMIINTKNFMDGKSTYEIMRTSIAEDILYDLD